MKLFIIFGYIKILDNTQSYMTWLYQDIEKHVIPYTKYCIYNLFSYFEHEELEFN